MNEAFDRARRLWSLGLASPVAYFVVGALLERVGWMAEPRQPEPDWAAWPWSVLPAVFGALLAGVLSLRRLRKRLLGVLGGDSRSAGEAAAAWLRLVYWSLGLADSLALAGWLGWMLSGRVELMLAGGVASYLGYWIARPTERETR